MAGPSRTRDPKAAGSWRGEAPRRKRSPIRPALRGTTVTLESLRGDRELREALAVGPDPLHLASVFGLDPKTATRYAENARQLLITAEEQDPPAPKETHDQPVPLAALRVGIDHSWDAREQIRAQIRQRLPELKRRGMQTNDLLVGLLQRRSPERAQGGAAAPAGAIVPRQGEVPGE